MRSRIRFVATAALLASMAAPVAIQAQRVEFDSTTGNYRVAYQSGQLGRSVVALVDPPNRIDPVLRLVDSSILK